MSRKPRPHLTIRLLPVGDEVSRRKVLRRIAEIVKNAVEVAYPNGRGKEDKAGN
ncbi:MAG: hypothetical protein ACPL5F_05965 [Moorellaceae bacterium]